MKISKRIKMMLLCLVMMVMLLPAQVFAAGKIDVNQDASLKLTFKENETLLSGAEFKMYRVADVSEYGELTLTDAFNAYSEIVKMDQLNERDENGWRELASTLSGYVQRDGMTEAASGKTGTNGECTITVKTGLYLVIGQAHVQDEYVYTSEPFMVLLPEEDTDTNIWTYECEAKPKCDSRTKAPIDRKVLKVWKDTGYESRRPESVTVQLLQDGNVYDTVTLNAANNWRYEWTGLSAYSTWNLVEKEISNYTVTTAQEGITFVVTNTYKKPGGGGNSGGGGGSDPDPKPRGGGDPGNTDSGVMDIFDEMIPLGLLPQTGQLWWPVPVLFAAGLFMIILGVIRRRGSVHEK